MILKKISQLKTLVQDFIAFLKAKFYNPPKNEKALLVQLENPNLYHRFFYLVLKFYQLSGYTIYYPMTFSKYRNLRNKDRYLGLIVREKNFLTINKKNLPADFITLKDENFSADYFKNYFEEQNQEKNAFHIPMSFHPFMYHHQLWNAEIDIYKERINALFCYGNFDSKAYVAIKRTNFKAVPRTELLRFFQNKSEYISLKNKDAVLNSQMSGKLDKKFVFAIKENYQIKMEEVREILSYFNFFLCCPGVVMPLCHNVIEAMSVGTIPVIQKEYAEVMYPNLQHLKNAIIFEDLEHLDQIIDQELFNYSAEIVLKLRKNVLEYYNDFLTPESVVKLINKSIRQKDLIYLQAEHRSVKFSS